MRLTESKLRQIIRRVIISEGPPGYDDYKDDLELDENGYLQVFANRTPSGITSMAGMDRYADHRGLFTVIREAVAQDGEIINFFEEAAKRALSAGEIGRDAWMEGYSELCGYMNIFTVPPKYYGFVYDFIVEQGMTPKEFIKKIY